MAFQLNFSTTLSEDKTYFTVRNNGTIWGSGINSIASISSMSLVVMGEDKSIVLKNVTLTVAEKNNFETGINLYFADSRLFSQEFAPDNYYVMYLIANSTYESNWDAIEVHLGLEEQVHINNATVNLRSQDLFQLENNVQAVIALDTMINLANEEYSEDREYRWRVLYYHIVDNIINKY